MSKTRSGKTYSKVISSCSFCNMTTHKIENCQLQQTTFENIHQKTIQASIFSDYITGHSEIFLQMWLQIFTLKELHTLGNYFAKSQNLLFDNKHSKMEQIKKLSSVYFWLVAGNPTREQFDSISDEIFIEFKKILLSNIKQEHQTFLEYIILIERPWLRRFNINVILDENAQNPNPNPNHKSCNICLTDNIDPSVIISTNCNHEYCRDCFTNHIKMFRADPKKEPNCAFCRTKITSIKTSNADDADYYKTHICRVAIMS